MDLYIFLPKPLGFWVWPEGPLSSLYKHKPQLWLFNQITQQYVDITRCVSEKANTEETCSPEKSPPIPDEPE